MKKEVISGLIVVVTIALIGLVVSQVYWIDSVVRQRTEQFNEEVKAAMLSAVQRIEREEMLNRFKAQHIIEWDTSGNDANYFNFKSDTTITTGEGGKLTIRVEQSSTSIDSSINIEIGTFKQNGNIARDEEDFIIKHPSNQEEIIVTQKVINERMRRKMRNVDQLLGGMFNFQFYRNIEDRIPYERLDSIVEQALVERGIETDYELGVFNIFNQPVMLNENHTREKVRKLVHSPYQARLFPTDLVQDSNFFKLYFPHQRAYVLHSMWLVLSSSAVLILVLIGVFWFTINAILKQKKISEIKNDFINNMTHELKTPIATISLACEALTDQDLNRSESMVDNFVGMIRDENKRLGTLVENVLKSAVLEKGDFKLKLQEVDINHVVEDVTKGMAIQAKNKGGNISLNLDNSIEAINADPIHITNVVYNLLDNAIKYTPEQPNIKVKTTLVNNDVVIKVSDNGVGISAENQKKIFDKLYRVPTGNVHNVKGFGLGLSYVKAIVEKHFGIVKVESALGEGTTIIISIPVNHEKGA